MLIAVPFRLLRGLLLPTLGSSLRSGVSTLTLTTLPLTLTLSLALALALALSLTLTLLLLLGNLDRGAIAQTRLANHDHLLTSRDARDDLHRLVVGHTGLDLSRGGPAVVVHEHNLVAGLLHDRLFRNEHRIRLLGGDH